MWKPLSLDQHRTPAGFHVLLRRFPDFREAAAHASGLTQHKPLLATKGFPK